MRQKTTERSQSVDLNPSSPIDVREDIRETSQTKQQEKATCSNHPPRTYGLLHSDNNRPDFTPEETDILLNNYQIITEVGRKQMIDFWESWANKYIRHSPQEWFNYFEEYVVPLKAASGENDASPPEGHLESIDTTIESSRQDKAASLSIQSSSNSTHRDYSRSKSRSKSRSESLIPTLSQNINYAEHCKNMMQKLKDPIEFPDPMIRDEELFELGIEELAKELGLELNLRPQINGEEISLFELWRTVQLLKHLEFDPVSGDRLWTILSEVLGINNCGIEEVKNCYNEILAGFEQLRHEFLLEAGLTKSQQHLIEDQNTANAEEPAIEQHDVKREEDSSPENREESENEYEAPVQIPHQKPNSPKKRSKSSDTSCDQPNLARRKRQRIGRKESRAQEIPSTPEHIIAGSERSYPTCTRSPRCTVQVVIEQSINSRIQGGHRNQNQSTKHPLPSGPEMIESSDTWDENETAPPLNPLAHTPPILDSISHGDEVLTQPDVIESREQASPSINARPSPSTPPRMVLQSGSEPINSPRQVGGQEAQTLHPPGPDTQSSSADELNDYITEMTETFGYPELVVIRALEATTMTIGPESNIEQVMQSLSHGKGIPQNLRGVWTEEDDQMLERSPRTKEYKQVVKKHGPHVRLRKEFKNYAREALKD